MEVKNRLKKIRMNEYTMERREFAKHLDVIDKTYYSLERGVSTPTLKQALYIARKLNKKVDDIWYLE